MQIATIADTGKNPDGAAFCVLFQRLTLHDRDVGSDGIVQQRGMLGNTFVFVSASWRHTDQTGTEALLRVYGGPQVSSIREQGAD